MLWFATIVMLVVVCEVQMQPVSCIEDVHCRDNWFCDIPAYVCRKCVECRDLNRIPPAIPLNNYTCLKSDHNCGLCLEGWTFDNYPIGSKCVPAEGMNVLLFYKLVLWLGVAGAAAGLVLTVLYLRVLRNTIFYIIIVDHN